MRRTVAYYHSLSSPWAYLGWPRFKTLIERHDLDVLVRPTRIVPENGGVPLRSRPQPRQDYHALELDRWRRRLGMPLVLKPRHYPTNNEFSARMVIAADRLGHDALALSHALLHALWSEELDVALPAVRIDVADRTGLDGAALQALEADPDVVAAWEASHREATRRGVFGTPTWIHDDVLYWGQDRLDFLDEALSAPPGSASRA